MRELPEILMPLANEHGIENKTELAGHMSALATASGLAGRDRRIADATILSMSRGERNDDDRIQKIALDTAVSLGLIPNTIKGIMRDRLEIDKAALVASVALSDDTKSQEDKQSILAVVKARLTDELEHYSRIYEQIASEFPEKIAEGPQDSFYGMVFAGIATTVYAATRYALYDVDDEVRYQLSEGTLAQTDFISEWLDDMRSLMEHGDSRVHFVNTTANLFAKAAASCDVAARIGEKRHSSFCSYLAATARENERGLRSDLADIKNRDRLYAFDAGEAYVARELLKVHEQSVGFVYLEARNACRLKDIDAIQKLRPAEHRVLRGAIYDALKEGNLGMVEKLQPKFAIAMKCDVKKVFEIRPPRAPQTLPLIEEPALQKVFKKSPKIAALVGITAKLIIVLVCAAALVTLLDKRLGVWNGFDTGQYLASQPSSPGRLPFDVVARPGSERLG